jgi:hypothetical protein
MKNLMKTKALLLAISGLVIAASAHAAPPIWSGSRTVTKVNVEADHTGSTAAGDTYVEFNSAPFSTPCTKNNTGTWVIGGNPDSQKALMQVALSAKLSGQAVRVLWNNTNTGYQACSGAGYPIIRGLELQP